MLGVGPGFEKGSTSAARAAIGRAPETSNERMEDIRTGILPMEIEEMLSEAEAAEAAEAERLRALDEEEIATKNEWEQSCELGQVYVDFA